MLRKHSFAGASTIFVLSQLGLCLRSSFLDCSSMVVLVASQRSPARESLLAVGVWALVGPFTGVYAAMSSQRRRIAEGLVGSRVRKKIHMKRLLGHTFPHRSHMCGFSPVCTRECTVNAERWMNCFPHPGQSQAWGLTPV